MSLEEESLVVSIHILNKRLRQSEEMHNIIKKYGCRFADRHELQNMQWGFFNDGSSHLIVRFNSS
jgi:hypothetical protein